MVNTVSIATRMKGLVQVREGTSRKPGEAPVFKGGRNSRGQTQNEALQAVREPAVLTCKPEGREHHERCLVDNEAAIFSPCGK